MTVLETIEDALRQITPEQIERMSQKLPPALVNETNPYVVQSLHAKALWTLANEYDRQAELLAHTYRFDPGSPAEQKALLEARARAKAFEDAVRELAWTEMRQEAAGVIGWDATVALRENFTIYESSPEPDNPFAGAIQIPLSVMRQIARKMVRQEEGDESPPKPPRRPQ